MWTPYGIRSMSNKDPFYEQAGNYWTAPIWININYLMISALNSYGKDESIEPVFRDQI